MKDECCENCRFCHENEFLLELECRRYPHIASYFEETGKRLVEFRITTKENWCGEWKPRREKDLQITWEGYPVTFQMTDAHQREKKKR